MLGFLRLLTNEQVMGGSTVTLGGALDLYDQWRKDPRVELAPEPPETEKCFRQALMLHLKKPGTKAVADCYLAGFAEAAGLQLVTFDKGLAAAGRARQVPVKLLKPTAVKPAAKMP